MVQRATISHPVVDSAVVFGLLDKFSNIQHVQLSSLLPEDYVKLFRVKQLHSVSAQVISRLQGVALINACSHTSIRSLQLDVVASEPGPSLSNFLLRTLSLNMARRARLQCSSLRSLSSLEELQLKSHNLHEIAALSTLNSLTKLSLYSLKGAVPVTELCFLLELTKLKELEFMSPLLEEQGPSRVLECLSRLNLLSALRWDTHNRVCGIFRKQLVGSLLANLSSLQTLSMAYSPLDDYSALANLQRLTALELAYDEIGRLSTLEPLQTLTRLRKLAFGGSPYISSLTPLSGLTRLETIESDYLVHVESLQPLAPLKMLQELKLRKGRVTDLDALNGLSLLTACVFQSVELNPMCAISNLKSLRTEVKNFQFLGKLTSLTELAADWSSEPELKGLRPLTMLRKLSLCTRDIVDVEDLSHLTSLSELHLDSSRVADAKPLQGLTKLEILSMRRTKVATAEFCSKLVALRILDLASTEVRTLKGLQGLSRLQHLHLQDCPVADLSPIASLLELSSLRLKGTWVHTVAPLQFLPKLSFLDLGYCSLAADTVTSLNGFLDQSDGIFIRPQAAS